MFTRITKHYFGSYILIFFLLLYLIIGCDDSKPQKIKADMPNYLTKFYSQKELDTILRVGMSPQEVINIFGVPLIKDNDLFVYCLDLISHKITKENKDAIIGFSVKFRNNKVITWHLAYTDLP